MAELWRRRRVGACPFPSGSIGTIVEKVDLPPDLLFVSSPSNITYLTGYGMIWYYLTSPVSVAVHAESG